MFLYPPNTPRNPSFALNAPLAARRQRAETGLYESTVAYEDYVQSAIARENAKGEAYRRRNQEIFEATGRQLTNPMQDRPKDLYLRQPLRGVDPSQDPGQAATVQGGWRDESEKQWQRDVDQLARDFPEHARSIRSGETIEDSAKKVAAGATAGRQAALLESAASGASTLGPSLAGSVVGMARDPMQVATLFVGGGFAAPAKTVGMRILQTMLSEAVVNGGAEGALVLASEQWRTEVGAEHGVAAGLQRVGLAALFGGGLGGLGRGAVEAFRALGRKAPPAVDRIVAGQARPGDIQEVATALGVPLDPTTARVAEIAAEQPALDAAAFGPAPAGTNPAEAERAAAQAVRAMEDPPDLPPWEETPVPLAAPSRQKPQDTWRPLEPQDRHETIDRIAKAVAPVGGKFGEKAPPPSLIEFLHNQGGLKDATELRQLGLETWSRTERTGGKKGFEKKVFLIREGRKAKSLDYAREAAEEAGYLMSADPNKTTTIADLLNALAEEQGGNPVYSMQDNARLAKYGAYMERQEIRDATERLLDEIDSAIVAHGRMPPDAVIRDTMDIMGRDSLSAEEALEKAIENDYRVVLSEGSDGAGITRRNAKVAEPDTGGMPGAGGRPGGPGQDGAAAAGGIADEGGRELPVPGGDEATESWLDAWRRRASEQDELIEASRAERLNPGPAVEPATAEAGEAADLALLEAKGQPSARAPEGEKPKPTEWDYIPAGTNPDGTTRYVTYDDMIADADKDDDFSKLIASCKL